MLGQNLKELLECGVIEKVAHDGYPLQTNYFLTERGEKIFEAVSSMQSVGIEMMIEDNREDYLRGKGLL